MLELKYLTYLMNNPLNVWIVAFFTSYVLFTVWFYLIVLDKYKKQLNVGLTSMVFFSFTLCLSSFVIINTYDNNTGSSCYILTFALYITYLIYSTMEEPLNSLRDALENDFANTSSEIIRLKPLKRFLLSFRMSFFFVFGLFVKIFIFMIILRIFIGISTIGIYTRIAAFLFLVSFGVYNFIKKKSIVEYFNFGLWDLMK